MITENNQIRLLLVSDSDSYNTPLRKLYCKKWTPLNIHFSFLL